MSRVSDVQHSKLEINCEAIKEKKTLAIDSIPSETLNVIINLPTGILYIFLKKFGNKIKLLGGGGGWRNGLLVKILQIMRFMERNNCRGIPSDLDSSLIKY